MRFLNAFNRINCGVLLTAASVFALAVSDFASPAFGQPLSADVMPPTAPDYQKRQVPAETTAEPGASTSAPETNVAPVIKPPDLPNRPPLIPIPDFTGSEVQPAQPPTPAHKRSLAWRSRAHKLKQSSSAQQKVFIGTYDEAIMALLSSLAQANLRVDTLNSKAGELLAVSVDPSGTQKYIFVFAEMPPGTVTVKAASWTTSKAAFALIESIMQSLDRLQPGRKPN